jgi:hypothetical protein
VGASTTLPVSVSKPRVSRTRTICPGVALARLPVPVWDKLSQSLSGVQIALDLTRFETNCPNGTFHGRPWNSTPTQVPRGVAGQGDHHLFAWFLSCRCLESGPDRTPTCQTICRVRDQGDAGRDAFTTGTVTARAETVSSLHFALIR